MWMYVYLKSKWHISQNSTMSGWAFGVLWVIWKFGFPKLMTDRFPEKYLAEISVNWEIRSRFLPELTDTEQSRQRMLDWSTIEAATRTRERRFKPQLRPPAATRQRRWRQPHGKQEMGHRERERERMEPSAGEGREGGEGAERRRLAAGSPSRAIGVASGGR